MGVEGYRNLKSWFSTTFGSSLKFVSQCLSHRQYAKLRRFQNPERKGLFTVPFCPRLTFRVFDKAEKEKYKKAWRYEWKEIAAASIQVVCYEDGELFRFRAKKKLNSYTDKWYGEIIGRKDFGELPIETALCTFQESIYGFGASTDLMKKVERQLQCEPIVKPHARIPLFCWTITLNRADLDIAALKEHQATVITEDRKEFWFGKTKKYYEKFNDFEWLPFSSHLERHLNDPASRFEWKEWKSSRKAWYLDVHERMLFCLISLFDAGLGQVAKFNCFNLEEMKGGTELNLKGKAELRLTASILSFNHVLNLFQTRW